jgi:DNA-binding transcriptional LysR family regulator
MPRPDLNLLFTLDVLLAEGSVAAAARRLRLSPSAMSRSLTRLRQATGDPLLVRAGRGLVPSPRAIELRGRVAELVQAAEAALRPVRKLDLGRLERTFTLRTSEGFVENFGARLVERAFAAAPGVRLRFVPKVDRQSGPLRDGTVDLETGVIAKVTGPEVRARPLFRDRFVGVVRKGHKLRPDRIDLERYLAERHVVVARDGAEEGPVDHALASVGRERRSATIVAGFGAAVALARNSDLVASVPERHTGILRDGMVTFDLPVAVPPITVSLLWHPRLDAEPAHRWLRDCVQATCAEAAR